MIVETNDALEKTIEVFENRDRQFVTIAKVKRTGEVASKVLEGFRISVDSVFSAA